MSRSMEYNQAPRVKVLGGFDAVLGSDSSLLVLMGLLVS